MQFSYICMKRLQKCSRNFTMDWLNKIFMDICEKVAKSTQVLPINKISLWMQWKSIFGYICTKVTESVSVSLVMKISLLIRKILILGICEKGCKKCLVTPIMKISQRMHQNAIFGYVWKNNKNCTTISYENYTTNETHCHSWVYIQKSFQKCYGTTHH